MRGPVALAALTLLAGCAGGESDGDGIDVAAAFYPLAEVAERVGGDHVAVTNLTPPGAEPHDLELSSDDLEVIEDAEVIVYVGGGFQPAVEDVARRVDVEVDVLGSERDPHVWLDPRRIIGIVERVRDVLTDLDDPAADEIRANADAYVAELEELDADYEAGLASCERRTIVTAHEAFGHLADRYGLTERALTGLAPEAEPDPARLADLADEVRAEGVTTVFHETLLPPDVAETLAREAGVDTAVLDPIEGLSDAQLEAGATYESVMRANLEALRAALGCR
jgi:zinc transport system substrate-binding protein